MWWPCHHSSNTYVKYLFRVLTTKRKGRSQTYILSLNLCVEGHVSLDMGVLSAAELGREQGVQASSLRGKSGLILLKEPLKRSSISAGISPLCLRSQMGNVPCGQHPFSSGDLTWRPRSALRAAELLLFVFYLCEISPLPLPYFFLSLGHIQRLTPASILRNQSWWGLGNCIYGVLRVELGSALLAGGPHVWSFFWCEWVFLFSCSYSCC